MLEEKIQEYVIISKTLWNNFSKFIRITKCSKVWWNEECNTKLNIYCVSKSLIDWIQSLHQKDKVFLLQQENTRNHIKEQKTMGLNKLGQEIKITSH